MGPRRTTSSSPHRSARSASQRSLTSWPLRADCSPTRRSACSRRKNSVAASRSTASPRNSSRSWFRLSPSELWERASSMGASPLADGPGPPGEVGSRPSFCRKATSWARRWGVNAKRRRNSEEGGKQAVSRVLFPTAPPSTKLLGRWWWIISLEPPLPAASSGALQTERDHGQPLFRGPKPWPCSRPGFTEPAPLDAAGALLPHPCTLT
jgi:hypothetical protein